MYCASAPAFAGVRWQVRLVVEGGVGCCGRQLTGGVLPLAAVRLVAEGGVSRWRGVGCCGRQHAGGELSLAAAGLFALRAVYSGGAVLVAADGNIAGGELPLAADGKMRTACCC